MTNFQLTTKEKDTLLKISRQTLCRLFEPETEEEISPEEITPALHSCCGLFVSLHIGKHLRGCIGQLKSNQPLFQLVVEVTQSAALNDRRFQPVSKEELSEVKIELSVLTPMQRISSIDELELGKHGIYIRKGSHSGTYLPQVGQKTNWSKTEFVSHCSKDKAGLGWDGWRNAELYRYEAIIFSE